MDPQKPSTLQTKLAILRREGEERAAQRLANDTGFPYVDLSKTPVSTDALKLVPENIARAAKAAATEIKVRKVAVAAVDPRTPAVQEIIKDLEAKKYEVKIFVASVSGLNDAWRFYKFIKAEVEGITGKVKIEKQRLEEFSARLVNFSAVKSEIDKLDFTKTSPVALLEIVLAGAMGLKSSDVHFEAGEKSARIRFRVDGLLHDIFENLPLKNYESLISRLKLLSGMKINVKGEPQDGRFTIGLGQKEIEIRASIIPSEFGETIVLRILDPDVIAVDFGGLGIRKDDLVIVSCQIEKPNGLILNTGPTGSGKTTTLYAFLKKVNSPEIKIITLEDPIEYRIPGIEQTQVDTEAGYTFANGLRAVVRQDPDIILVGEIRDLDTADIALQASLTGHLVLSTLHTNDAVGAIPRLINLGVKVVSIGPALNLIIAQRLVRRLCANCKKAKNLDAGTKTKLNKFLKDLPSRVERAAYENFKIYEAVGCDKCNNLGYKGRIGLYEFLEGGLALEEVILKEVSEVALTKFANSQGMVTMQADGILKVLQGLTSFEEVESVTGKIEWA